MTSLLCHQLLLSTSNFPRPTRSSLLTLVTPLTSLPPRHSLRFKELLRQSTSRLTPSTTRLLFRAQWVSKDNRFSKLPSSVTTCSLGAWTVSGKSPVPNGNLATLNQSTRIFTSILPSTPPAKPRLILMQFMLVTKHLVKFSALNSA